MAEAVDRKPNAAIGRFVYVLVEAAFVLLWAWPNLSVERFVEGLHPTGFAAAALRLLQMLFAVSMLAPVCFWLYRDRRIAHDNKPRRDSDPGGLENPPSVLGHDYASRRVLAVRRQHRRDLWPPFELSGEAALYLYLSRLFGFLLVVACLVVLFGATVLLILLFQISATGWAPVVELIRIVGGTALVAVLADAVLSHALGAYYNPDRGRMPFEYLVTLSFLASFRLPVPPGADARTDANGWRGVA